jgi:Ser/Thr protein kinase RdoA (MazF antagonist)
MTREDGSSVSYILQRINDHVFKHPEHIMENIQRVTDHLKNKENCAFKQPVYLIPTHAGQCFHVDSEGNYWRTFNYIQGAHTYDEVESSEQSYHGARAFGFLQSELADLPGDALHETIPDFHNTPKRYEAFEAALRTGLPDRIALAQKEIAQAQSLRDLAPIITDLLESGKIPPRVTHNDTKLNNVLLEEGTYEGLCVIDLDTLMSGSALYDFGDYVRTAARIGAEDEPDLAKVHFCTDMYEAALRGYLEAAGSALNDVEKEHLAVSAIVITYELGLRFLTDFIQGDTYFKVKHPRHNLDRTRVQFKMVKEIQRHLPLLNDLLRSVVP